MAITDKISSEYIRSQNALNKRKGKIIRVFVENEDDIPFWKNIFNKFKIQTKINPAASETSLTRGKQEVLKFKDGAGEFLLLCVDSDYDYLSDGATETSKIIKENPFIFQTYTYSIENYKCFADSLHQVVVEATLNDNPIFDYKAFFEKYSELTYELFLYSFFYDRKNQQEVELHQKEYKIKAQSLDEESLKKWQNDNQPEQTFPIKDFCKCIKILNHIDMSDDGKQELAVLTQKVDEKLASLPQIDQNILENLKKELSELGLSPKNTYLFIQGHTMYDNVVLMFLIPIYQRLKKEKFEEFKHNARTEEEKENKINDYKKAITADIESILRNHTNYQDCFLMSKIESDIKDYILLYPIS